MVEVKNNFLAVQPPTGGSSIWMGVVWPYTAFLNNQTPMAFEVKYWYMEKDLGTQQWLRADRVQKGAGDRGETTVSLKQVYGFTEGRL